MGTLKLALVVGHERNSKGAVMVKPYRVSEYVFNTEIAQLATEYAARNHPNVEVKTFFRDGVGISGAYKAVRKYGADAAIELHFNAFQGNAQGTSTLCSDEAVDKAFARVVQDHMLKVFDRVNGGKGDRGLRVNPPRGGLSVRSLGDKPNCLVEPFFGDNPADAKMAMERKAQYAGCLVEAFVAYMGGAK